MLDFISFCRSHGILINSLPPPGVWRRYRTEDHPRKKNGAVKFLVSVYMLESPQILHQFRCSKIYRLALFTFSPSEYQMGISRLVHLAKWFLRSI